MSSNLISEKLFEMALQGFINRSNRDLENCKAARYFDDILTRVKDDNDRRISGKRGKRKSRLSRDYARVVKKD